MPCMIQQKLINHTRHLRHTSAAQFEEQYIKNEMLLTYMPCMPCMPCMVQKKAH